MCAPTPAGINSLLFALFVGLDGNAMTGVDVLSQWQVVVAAFSRTGVALAEKFGSQVVSRTN